MVNFKLLKILIKIIKNNSNKNPNYKRIIKKTIKSMLLEDDLLLNDDFLNLFNNYSFDYDLYIKLNVKGFGGSAATVAGQVKKDVQKEHPNVTDIEEIVELAIKHFDKNFSKYEKMHQKIIEK